MRGLRRIGVPYTDADIAGARTRAQSQADSIAASVVSQGGPERLARIRRSSRSSPTSSASASTSSDSRPPTPPPGFAPFPDALGVATALLVPARIAHTPDGSQN